MVMQLDRARRPSFCQRPGRGFLLVLLLAVSAGAGCAQELSLRTPGFSVRSARVAFMPAMVALYSIEEDDSVNFDESRSMRARMKVNTWLRYLAPRLNCRVVDLREVATTPLSSDAFYTRLDQVTKALVADSGRRPLTAWVPGDPAGFQSWAATLNADYVVFIAFKGAYETEARRQARMTNMFIAGGVIGALAASARRGELFAGAELSAAKRAALVVVDLHGNRIVRAKAIDFDYLENLEIPADLSNLMEALELGRPITVAEP
jgi:hypothetical protein